MRDIRIETWYPSSPVQEASISVGRCASFIWGRTIENTARGGEGDSGDVGGGLAIENKKQ